MDGIKVEGKKTCIKGEKAVCMTYVVDERERRVTVCFSLSLSPILPPSVASLSSLANLLICWRKRCWLVYYLLPLWRNSSFKIQTPLSPQHTHTHGGINREREITLYLDGCKYPEEQCHGEHGGYTLPCHFSLSSLCRCLFLSLLVVGMATRLSKTFWCLFLCWNIQRLQAPYIDAEETVRSNPLVGLAPTSPAAALI
jgi:hypothetical protein